METGFITLLVLSIIGSLVIGVLIGMTLAHRRYVNDTRYTQGTLNVDCSDPEFEPGLFLGLGVPVKDVATLKYITLDVVATMKNSHK